MAAVFLRRRRLAALTMVAGIALLSMIVGVTVGAGGRARAPARTARPSLEALAMLRPMAKVSTNPFGEPLAAAENAAIDRTLAYTPFVRVAGTQRREVALTFDDGPGPYTPAVLTALARAHAPATFFEVGFMLQWFHASTSAILARGDVIGDHTELHQSMTMLSRRDQRTALLEQTATIAQYGAPFPRLFRPPYGAYDHQTLALLHRYRMLMVMWTVDSDDYERPGVPEIVHNVLSAVRPGAIILLHDAGGNRLQTVAAIPRIVRALRARGYRLVTVPRLLLDDPAPRDQDSVPAPKAGVG